MPEDRSPEDELALLERFVIENDDLAELEAEIGRFNIFDALQIVRQEIRHSNFLAWLLDPAESHGLGQLFLRYVLMDMMRAAPPSDRPLSPIDLDGADLGGVEIRREWRNIDLLILADDPRICIAIENKIDSGEGSGQLKRYRRTCEEHLPDHRPLYVFLTRAGDEPSESDWVAYSYADLYGALERCRRINADAMGGDVEAFLDHYLRIIRSRFMDDPKIDELCDRIYRNHRQALDLIFERKGDPRRRVTRAVADHLIETYPEFDVYCGGYGCEFVPTEWKKFIPPVALYTKLGPHPLVRGFVWSGTNDFEGYIIVGQSSDDLVRTRLIDLIKKRGNEFGLSVSGKQSSQWTRIRSKRRFKTRDALEDDDQTLAKARAIADELVGSLREAEPLLRSVFEDPAAPG